MLPTENRLRRRQDFATAVRRGRRAGRPLLVVHLSSGNPSAGGASSKEAPPVGDTRDPHAAGGSSSPARAGFVVGKAVGNAVERNLVKRRLRHLVRERLLQLPPGSLIVVRALPGSSTASHAELARDLDAALRRLLPAKAGGAR